MEQPLRSVKALLWTTVPALLLHTSTVVPCLLWLYPCSHHTLLSSAICLLLAIEPRLLRSHRSVATHCASVTHARRLWLLRLITRHDVLLLLFLVCSLVILTSDLFRSQLWRIFYHEARGHQR